MANKFILVDVKTIHKFYYQAQGTIKIDKVLSGSQLHIVHQEEMVLILKRLQANHLTISSCTTTINCFKTLSRKPKESKTLQHLNRRDPMIILKNNYY